MWIKDFYCPHCGQFRGKGQIYFKYRAPLVAVPYCRYCDRVVQRTEPLLKKFIKEKLNDDAKTDSK